VGSVCRIVRRFGPGRRALPGRREPEAFLFPRHAEGQGDWSLTTCWRPGCCRPSVGSSMSWRNFVPGGTSGDIAGGHIAQGRAERVDSAVIGKRVR